MSSSAELLPQTTRHLSRLTRLAQNESKVPGLVAGVARHGTVLWSEGVGRADLTDDSVPLGADTQWPVASNTKTFVASMIMQLRDEGRLRLDDTVDTHIPESTHGNVTVRQLLSHTTGMQREPIGDVWDVLKFPDRAALITGWNDAERIMRPHYRWHYSNLCYAMLGEIIARLDGREWTQSLQHRLLDPLELRRTTIGLVEPHSRQYYVSPVTDVPVDEPALTFDAMSAAGAICSTLSDMVRWHGFLLDPDSSVLSPDTVEEMRQPLVTVDAGWNESWGLGLELVRSGGRVWFGHTGGLPGAITGFFSEAESGTTAAVLMNNSSAKDPAGTAIKLGTHVIEHDPEEVDAWTPGTVAPAELLPLLGQWYSEGVAFTFAIADGRLTARIDRAPASTPPSVFERIEDDCYRTISGGERGERLVIRRREDGSVRQLNWATYRFTRQPLGFAEPTP
ncbi:serine hydrolase domain-containing protein [Rudaeicoccus suwonensis]|uniref:CubicO group peptidase (Beta-lactamase class C family) n=1 Tax=Rudaeicoccus suwonensis TaxID=657409 RepID=A0A561E2Y5_9MICO|nr:serine hydrolase domain-containing protein [Rudaeicoccus suwonensis]TWE09974.1 CubicO group peptidase (beta-lactamase class C family) [Rudaeicoccus suwonensis]